MTATFNGWQSTSDSRCLENYTKRDDVIPTTSISEGTSKMTDVGRFNNENGNESDVDPVPESGVDSSEIT